MHSSFRRCFFILPQPAHVSEVFVLQRRLSHSSVKIHVCEKMFVPPFPVFEPYVYDVVVLPSHCGFHRFTVRCRLRLGTCLYVGPDLYQLPCPRPCSMCQNKDRNMNMSTYHIRILQWEHDLDRSQIYQIWNEDIWTLTILAQGEPNMFPYCNEVNSWLFGQCLGQN